MGESKGIRRSQACDDAGCAPDPPLRHRRTEVGVIPEDWGLSSLGSVLAEAPRYGINAPAVRFDGSRPAYIRITDIGPDGRFRPSPRVSVDGAHLTRYFLRPGDLVFARTGSVGKSYLYDSGDGPLVFAGFLIRMTTDPRQLRPDYLAHYCQTKTYWAWVAKTSVRSGQPGINSREYRSLPVPLPPVTEQRAIVAVLSDVDELIGSLEALITKKRAIKRAAMQELLTGRTRLPGFTEDWRLQRFEEVVTLVPSGRFRVPTSAYRATGRFPVIDQGKEPVVAWSDCAEKVFTPPVDGAIVFGDHTRIVKFQRDPFVLGADGTRILTCRGGDLPEFVFHALRATELPNTGYNRHLKFLLDARCARPSWALQGYVWARSDSGAMSSPPRWK